MEARNETQTSETQEKNRRTLVRCDSMEGIKPHFSRDPDGPVNFNSGETSACSEEHTTSLRQQQLKTTPS
ncbi:hypothetical protein G5714_021051 [Onychostoma macrolepis]|uniref:Uncharacterized protein n=1 Tax=Onychostoma macrolepis TaxID=369639 RepID=A0A7J6BW78_9TELE|nr:hypothetical protein G5714_021051 [Onychostoma macrolepis]